MKVTSLVAFGCLMACMICSAGFAQDVPVAEIFGGLSIHGIGDQTINVDDESFKIDDSGGTATGWGLSFAYNLNPSFAVKVDTSGQYAGVENCDDCSVAIYGILGGIQYTKRYEKFNVFAEGLVGLATYGEKVGNESDTYKGLGLSFGGGFDWKFSENFHWRVAQINYTHSRPSLTFDGDDLKLSYNGFRFQTGILIPLGK